MNIYQIAIRAVFLILFVSIVTSPMIAKADITNYHDIYTLTKVNDPSRTVTFFQFSTVAFPGITYEQENWGFYFGEISSAVTNQSIYTGIGRWDLRRVHTTWNSNPCCTGTSYPGASNQLGTENFPHTPQNIQLQSGGVFLCRGYVNNKPMFNVQGECFQ